MPFRTAHGVSAKRLLSGEVGELSSYSYIYILDKQTPAHWALKSKIARAADTAGRARGKPPPPPQASYHLPDRGIRPRSSRDADRRLRHTSTGAGGGSGRPGHNVGCGNMRQITTDQNRSDQNRSSAEREQIRSDPGPYRSDKRRSSAPGFDLQQIRFWWLL